MKVKLTRDERIGAAILALFVFLLVGGAFLLRSCGNGKNSAPPQVRVIYEAPDAAADSTSASEGKKEKNKKGKSSKDKKGKSTADKKRSAPKDNKKNAADSPSRDFLNDPVPLDGNR